MYMGLMRLSELDRFRASAREGYCVPQEIDLNDSKFVLVIGGEFEVVISEAFEEGTSDVGAGIEDKYIVEVGGNEF